MPVRRYDPCMRRFLRTLGSLSLAVADVLIPLHGSLRPWLDRRLFAEQRRHPAGRHAGAGQQPHRTEEVLGLGLHAAVPRRAQHREQPGLVQPAEMAEAHRHVAQRRAALQGDIDAAAIVRKGMAQVMEGRRIFAELTVVPTLLAGTGNGLGSASVPVPLPNIRATVFTQWATQDATYSLGFAFSDGAGGVVILIVALFAAFGVLNSMMMAVFERTREFGVLNAIGTQPWLFVLSLLVEAVLLAAVGLALGLAAGAMVMRDMVTRGWDLTRWTGELTMMGARLDPVWRGLWQWDQVAWAATGLLAATLIAVLVAAGRLLRLDPVQAMAAPTES